MKRVVVVGAVTVDILVHGQRLPGRGETIHGSSSYIALGGKGANQAVAARRAGAVTAMMGATGSDQFGKQVRHWLAAEGIDFISHQKAAPTGVGLSMVGAAGENAIMVALGANTLLGPTDLEGLKLSACDIVLVQAEVRPETNRALVERARALGCTIVLNMAPFSASLDDLMGQVDFVVVNEVEFEQWQGGGARAAVRQVLQSLVGRLGRACGVIVTLGSGGVMALIDRTVWSVTGHSVAALDTTGAGDCFCGYFTACLALGRSVPEALAHANAAAALSVQQPGAAPAMPVATDVTRFLDASGCDGA